MTNIDASPYNILNPLKTDKVPVIDQDSKGSVFTILKECQRRQNWALSLQSEAQSLFERIESSIKEIAVVKQGVDISLVHLHHHSAGLQKSFESSVDFAMNLDKDAAAGANWRDVCKKLERIKIHPALLAGDTEQTYLSNWIDFKEIQRVSKEFDADRQKIRSGLQSLKTDVEKVTDQGEQLETDAHDWIKTPTAPQYEGYQGKATDGWRKYSELAEDIGTIVRKIEDDCAHIATLPDSASNIKSALRIMLLHEREFLPNLRDMVQDLWHITDSWVKSKEYAQTRMVRFLNHISRIQSQTSPLRVRLGEIGKQLRANEDQRVILARAVDMPYLYGALLLEFIRREEWLAEVKSTVSKSASVMAGWIDDEAKQRNKWMRQYGGSLGMLKRIGGDGTMDLPDIEVSLVGSKNEKHFNISREDLENYLKVLHSLQLDEEYEELKRQLDNFTRTLHLTPLRSLSPPKKFKQLFKSGSISEYQQGDGGLMRRNSTSSTTEPNDAVIKGYEARIRKLEDLLHRNQFRETWTNKFQKSSNNNISKTESTSNEEMQKLKDRIKQLEDEKEESGRELENAKKENETLATELEKNKSIYEGAQMMKSDLLANIAAKEAEFNTERKLLGGEIADLKERRDDLERELEKEADRCLELENQVASLQLELEDNEKSHSLVVQSSVAEKLKLEENNKKLQTRFELVYSRARDMSQRLYTSYKRSCDLLECLGLQSSKVLDDSGELLSFKIQRVKGLGRRSSARNSAAGISNSLTDLTQDANGILDSATTATEKPIDIDPKVFYWLDAYYNEESGTVPELDEDDGEKSIISGSINSSGILAPEESERIHKRQLSKTRELRYRQFLGAIYLDYDLFRDSITKRFNDVEHLARKLQKEARNYRERAHVNEQQNRHKLAFKGFQKGDLALFLPTRDQSRDPNPWAAFNVGAPHYFLKPEQEHQLENREWLVGRITKVEDRVVDRAHDTEDSNPFDLSDGLRWHLIEAKEER